MQQIATASGNLSPRTEVTRAATAAVSRPERSPTMAWAGRTDEGMKFILTGLGCTWKRNNRQIHLQGVFKLQPKAPLYLNLTLFRVTSVTGPFQPFQMPFTSFL